MLQVGVRYERSHCIENQAPLHRFLPIGIQRQDLLNPQDGKNNHEHHSIEYQQTDSILLPVLIRIGGFADDPAEKTFRLSVKRF